MTTEEIIDFLKENLTIELDIKKEEQRYSSSAYIKLKVVLKLDGDEISSSDDYFDLPKD